MGVPSFYRWLVNKYPDIRVTAIEEKGVDIDTSSPNPNGMEFDNLYLDMNGIIHPCFHPEDQSLAPTTYEDVFESIYEYIDNLFRIVRPRKLLYVAIDGVAPRAKMNQQRSRRFRAAMDDEIAAAEEDRLRIQFEMEGKPVLPKVECEVSDSNVITPGTEFMFRLSKKLEGYIESRLNSDPGWKEIQDADLIMLALATHEVHFSILREFLHVWILREYLELDMKMTDAPENFRFDLERIIDDFIFMCFFAGNDFLPHMPTLEIHEGAIYLLMTVYKEQFKNIGGYLVDMQWVQDKKGGYVKLRRVEKFILLVGTYEEKIFKKRSELRERKLRRLCQYSDIQDEENEIGSSDLPRGMCKDSSADKYELLRNTIDLKEKLKENLRTKSDLFKNGDVDTDRVRLGIAGWKERYYKQQFSADTKQEIEIMRKEIVQKYTEGLLWVLLYYFSGVPSWSWFYPYHYGPFASDLKGLSQVRVNFQKDHPFKPFYQLMSVLPPRSAHALPTPYAKLITDMDSRIIDFYPTDFGIDTDGKRYAWQGICKLPFIDEERLIVETRRVEKELTPEDSKRNAEKVDQLFVSSNLGTKILTLFLEVPANEKVHMDANVSGGIGGFVWLRNYDHLTSPPKILSLLFELPDGNPHIPRPLEGVEYPTKTITAGDIQKTLLWHDYPGSRPPYNRPQSQATCTKANSSSKSPSSSTAECQRNHISRKFSSDQIFEIHKVSGTGWGAERGASACNSSIGKGIADMKISESSHNPGSYGRGQTVTNTFWSSRNASTQSLNHTWRKSLHANTNPSSQSLGRGQSDWDSKNGRNSANALRQGQGRGQFIPSTSASRWHSGDSTKRFS
ncbi:hypothetical protein CRYUN_Cryun02cG0164500 [Craigia yunnanensis]